MESLALAAMPAVAASGVDGIMSVVLDPDGINGAPEIVYVDGHTAGAITANVIRGREGTTAREHKAGIEWVHGATAGWASQVQGVDAELRHWQHRAALLDPLAYVFGINTGSEQNTTVPADTTHYVVNAWYCDLFGNVTTGGVSWFHRHAHIHSAHPMPPGTMLSTSSTAGSFWYVCKPELVIAADDRYTDDPRALYFERLERIATELTQHQIGTTRTDNGTTDVAFPADFDYGLGLHTTAHDVAWLILEHSSGSGGMNTQNEISDTERIRFAEPTLFPFARATFPNVSVRGATQAEGRATLTYAKLPADW
jgi:hypothetical protein